MQSNTLLKPTVPTTLLSLYCSNIDLLPGLKKTFVEHCMSWFATIHSKGFFTIYLPSISQMLIITNMDNSLKIFIIFQLCVMARKAIDDSGSKRMNTLKGTIFSKVLFISDKTCIIYISLVDCLAYCNTLRHNLWYTK